MKFDMSLGPQAKCCAFGRSRDSSRRQQLAVTVDVAVIAARTSSWRKKSRREAFEHLFFRLNVIPFEIPRWREGPKMCRVVNIFISALPVLTKKPKRLIEAIEPMQSYTWQQTCANCETPSSAS